MNLDGKQLQVWCDEFFTKWQEGWNNHDGVALQSLFHDDGTYWDPDSGTITKDQFPGMIEQLHNRMPDNCFAAHFQTIIVQRTSPTTFCVTGRWTMLGADGRVRLPGIDFLEFEGDKIARATTYFDNLQIAKQITQKPGITLPTDTDLAIKKLKENSKWQPQLLAKY